MNVIVIMLDSFRQDHIGFYNHGKAVFEDIEPCRTPNIDRFAREWWFSRTLIPEGYLRFQ